MATADVYIPEALATSLQPKGEFFNTVKIPTADFKTKTDTDVPADVDKEYFVLDSEHFVALQLYLLAAAHLPSSKETFTQTYPEQLFDPHYKRDPNPPPLYELTKSTLVDINNHCYEFSRETLSPMISLAGYIANFAEEANESSKELKEYLEIITNSDALMSDKKVQGAIQDASAVLDRLKDMASDNSKKCGQYAKKVSDFKELTKDDKIALEIVHKRTLKVLPTEENLNESLRAEMKAAREALSDLAKDQNKARAKKRANEGIRWYYFVPWVGWGMAIDDSIDSYKAGREISIANQVYQRVYELADQNLKTMISFRERCGNLLAIIKNIHEAIQNAETALHHLHTAFSKLETDLDYIQKQLGYAEGYVQKSDPQRRKGALKLLDRASDLWAKVQRLAANFQKNGLLVQADMKKELEKPAQVPPSLEILSSNYGGNDVTVYSRIIFNDGADLSVPTVEPGFPEAWESVKKSISLLHSYGGEKRIFVCGEYSGTHKIKRGPIQNSQDSGSVCNVVNPFPKPDGATAQILAIVWGKQEVRDPNVYNYCYERRTKDEKIKWSNDTMGGDTWYGMQKSGVIYYTVDGGSSVKQTAGRESTETEWRG